MSYITLGRGHWYYIIVLNVHASTEDKNDDKDNFYKELEHVFNQILKYNMTILLGDFNAKVGEEDIFKPTIRNESLQEISNNGVGVVNFVTSKNVSGVQCSHTITFTNTLEFLLVRKHTTRLITS
jgi:hypothetical protein